MPADGTGRLDLGPAGNASRVIDVHVGAGQHHHLFPQTVALETDRALRTPTKNLVTGLDCSRQLHWFFHFDAATRQYTQNHSQYWNDYQQQQEDIQSWPKEHLTQEQQLKYAVLGLGEGWLSDSRNYPHNEHHH